MSINEKEPVSDETEWAEIKERRDRILLDIQKKKLDLAESIHAKGQNVTKEEMRAYIAEWRRLETKEMSLGGPIERGILFNKDTPEFLTKNDEAAGKKNRPVDQVAGELFQLINTISERMAGARKIAENKRLDIYQRNADLDPKHRRSIQGSRFKRYKKTRSTRELQAGRKSEKNKPPEPTGKTAGEDFPF